MKLDLNQDLALGRLTLTMAENCHGDSQPLVETVQFNRFHERISSDTAALAGAMIASRWCGEVLEFSGFKIGSDVAEAVRLIVPDARFVQPIDGFRRNLCEGHVHLLVSQPREAASVVESSRSNGGLIRLVTWSGEFVCSETGSSADRIAGEISTTADILLSAWETSVCLGLLAGGLRLGSILIQQPEEEHSRDLERITAALRFVGVHLRTVPVRARERNDSIRHRAVADEEERNTTREDQRPPLRPPALAVV